MARILAPKTDRKVRRSRTVRRIPVVVVPLAVVQVRKPRQHGRVQIQLERERPPVKQDPAPVRHPVIAVGKAEPELRPHNGYVHISVRAESKHDKRLNE